MIQLLATGGTAAGHLGGGTGLDLPIGRIVVSLLTCLLIAVLAVVFLRQRAGKLDLRTAVARLSSRRVEIEIVEVRRLSPHGDVALIRQADREYLVLIQAGRSTILRERDSPPSAPVILP